MNFKSMYVVLLSTATILFPCALLAQAEQNGPPPSNQPQPQPGQQTAMPSMQDSTGSSGQTAQVTKDKMFIRKAIEGGIAEVQFGQLAAQKAASEDVKALGQKMVEDHTALNKDMEGVAESVGVMLPKHMGKENQAEYDKLNGLSGDEFDKEYLTVMVKAHHKDLREFRMEAAGTQDAALRDAVVKGAGVIHEHLVMVDKLAKSKGVEVPARGGNKPVPPPAE